MLSMTFGSQKNRATGGRDAVIRELGNVVNTSPEAQALVDDMANAWKTIRGIRKAFDLIATRLAGNLDGRFYSVWQNVPSLDINVISEPTDETYAEIWESALHRLLTDPNASIAPTNPVPFPKLVRPA